MRYLLDAALFAAAFALATSLFDNAVCGLAAGAILAGAWEALQGKRA
jgi:hypothetical protein